MNRPILVMLYVKSRFFSIACGIQLDDGVHPPGGQEIAWNPKKL